MAGFVAQRGKWDLLAKEPKGWRNILGIMGMPEARCLISIDDEYFVSLGAHAPHALLLLDRAAPRPLDLALASEICAQLTFRVASPVTLYPKTSWFRSPERKWHESYFEALRSVAELTDIHGALAPYTHRGHFHCFRAALPPPPAGHWWHCTRPHSVRTRRMLAVYQNALLSVQLPTRYLNFWRIVEAAIPKKDRLRFYASLRSHRLTPVWGLHHVDTSDRPPRRVNLVARVRRAAIDGATRLRSAHGSDEASLDHLWTRRGKVAHADDVAAEYDHVGDLVGMARETELLHYLARAAIESTWG